MSNLICTPFLSLITPFTLFFYVFSPGHTPSQRLQHQIPLWNRSPDGSEYIIHPHDHTLLNISLWQSCIIIVDSVSSCHSTAPSLVVFPHSPSGLKKKEECGPPFFRKQWIAQLLSIVEWQTTIHTWSRLQQDAQRLAITDKNCVALSWHPQNAYCGV